VNGSGFPDEIGIHGSKVIVYWQPSLYNTMLSLVSFTQSGRHNILPYLRIILF